MINCLSARKGPHENPHEKGPEKPLALSGKILTFIPDDVLILKFGNFKETNSSQ